MLLGDTLREANTDEVTELNKETFRKLALNVVKL